MSFALFLAVSTVRGSISPLPPVLPKPVSMTRGAGPGYVVTRRTVLIDQDGSTASKLLEGMFKRGAGFELKKAHAAGRSGAILLLKAPKGALREGEYKLHAGKDGVRIWYGDKGGAVYAVQTLRQLLPTDIEGPKPSVVKWTIPAVEIRDYPRFSWRGMHLDVSRHFFPPSFIEKYLDYIAMMKMNVFHWHLVDDGGWRLEIKKYPKLTSVGAWRYGITTGWDQSKLRFDPESGLPKYGGYYTQEQVKEIVKYAADRNINIVPEIEMPGHTMPVFAAYPELMCQDQPASGQEGQPRSNVYCVGNEKTFQFIEGVLDEVMALFPSKWIHIGGDEVDKEHWHRCSLCQAKMKAEGMKNEEELQSYFVRHIDKYLASKGRRLIGWDEILEGGLAKGATVMSWRGIDGGIAAARAGHDVVMSPTSHCYFDFAYSGQSTEHVYTFEPVPAALSATEARHVLGGQANVWCEWIPTEARCEFMIWPRMAAMSEVLWSPTEGRDVHEFLARLNSIFPRLDKMDTSYFLPAPRIGMTAYLFRGSAQVGVEKEAGVSRQLRYTTDGSIPSASSPIYTKPIRVNRPTTVKFAYLTAGGKPGEISQVDCMPAHIERATTTKKGWRLSYFEGTWTSVPDFAKMQPVVSGYANRIGFDMKRRAENFAFDLNGYFRAAKDGVYRFSLSSDDGSWLKVGNAKVIDNDGLHSGEEKEGSVWLPKGLHKIEVGYFQATGDYSLNLHVQCPGLGVARADDFVYTDSR